VGGGGNIPKDLDGQETQNDEENKFNTLKHKLCSNQQSTSTNSELSFVTANTLLISVGLVSSMHIHNLDI
jgi:hypothetical protein